MSLIKPKSCGGSRSRPAAVEQILHRPVAKPQICNVVLTCCILHAFPNGKALEESAEAMTAEQIWNHVCEQVPKDLWEDANMPDVLHYLYSSKKLKMSEQLKAKYRQIIDFYNAL